MGLPSADNNWDFWTLLQEALHQVTIVISYRGIANLADAEAAAVAAANRECHGRDLLNAIEARAFPRWMLFSQVMTKAQAKVHKHNPFDRTKA
jgi:catalase